MLIQLPRPSIPSVSCETMDKVHHPQEMLSSLKTAVRSELISYEGAFDLQIPILFHLRDITCVFFRSRTDRAPGKWVKSLPCFLCGCKIIGKAQRLLLPDPVEPGFPFGDACGTSPACLPCLLQALPHPSSASPAAAVQFLPCSPCGRSCSPASVGVTATFVKTHKL